METVYSIEAKVTLPWQECFVRKCELFMSWVLNTLRLYSSEYKAHCTLEDKPKLQIRAHYTKTEMI